MVSNLVTSVETFELSIVKIEGTQSCSEFLLRYLEDLKITKNATDAPIPVAPTMEVKKMDGNGEFKLKFD